MHVLMLGGGAYMRYKNTSPRLCTENVEGLRREGWGGSVFVGHYGIFVIVYISASFIGMLVLEWPYACICKVIMVN